MKVTDEHIHDSKMLPKIVDAIAKSKHVTVGKIIADGLTIVMLFLNVF